MKQPKQGKMMRELWTTVYGDGRQCPPATEHYAAGGVHRRFLALKKANCGVFCGCACANHAKVPPLCCNKLV